MAFRKVFSSSLTDKGIRKIFVQTTDGKNISCRKCHSARIIWVGEKRFRCKKCWSFGSLTAGTFLDGNRLSLRFWYELVWNFVLSHSANKTGKLFGKAINLFAGSLFKKVLMTERKSPEPWRWMRVFSEEHSKTSGRKLDGNIADWDWLKKEEEQLLENSRCLGSLKEMAVSI